MLAHHAADAGKIPEAEQYYQRALDTDGQNTSVWIARGRFFAERGEQEKADAEFAKAASLTSNELGKFLEGGWWVVGPYAPYLLEESCPPEREADPSKKVELFDSRTLLPPTPASWSHVPTGREGRVDPAFRVPQMNDCSAYAMTYIYSPDARTATLWVGGKNPLGVWLNGTYLQSVTTPDLWEHLLPRVPVALRAGRNSLLVKVCGGADARSFFVRLGDHPADRGFEAARYCRWREAATDLAEALERNTAASDHVWRYQALFALAAGDTEEFRRRAATLLAQYKDSPNDEVRFSLGHLCSFAQDPLTDHQTLVGFVEKGPNAGPRHAWNKLYVGLAYYRAGRWQDAIDAAQPIEGIPVETQPVAWPILAMANHQLQRKEEAARWLQKSAAWIDSCATTLARAPGSCWRPTSSRAKRPHSSPDPRPTSRRSSRPCARPARASGRRETRLRPTSTTPSVWNRAWHGRMWPADGDWPSWIAMRLPKRNSTMPSNCSRPIPMHWPPRSCSTSSRAMRTTPLPTRRPRSEQLPTTAISAGAGSCTSPPRNRAQSERRSGTATRAGASLDILFQVARAES